MKDDYVNDLNELLKERTGINFEEKPEIHKEPFLGAKIGCPVRELAVICLKLRKI